MQLADVLIGAEKAIYDKNAVAEGGWTGWRFFKVAEKSKQTDNVTSFKLVPVDNGKMPEVKAGQYISVRVFVKGQDLIQPRQYTVVKADATSLTIAVKKVEAVEKSPAGMVSNTLHNDINEGDVVEVSFPVGEFNLPEGNGELCLLSAGIGITPLFAMLKEACRKIRLARSLSFTFARIKKLSRSAKNSLSSLRKATLLSKCSRLPNTAVLPKTSSRAWFLRALTTASAVRFPS